MSPLLQHPSLNDKIYETLRDMIIEGELKPGSRLREDILVNMLGSSKTPIKLAVVRLEQDGLVKSIPRRGSYVIELTEDMTREIYSLREVLEGLAARLAAQNISERQIERLRKILPKMESRLKKSNYAGFVNHDEEFHDIIRKASDHDRLIRLLQSLFYIIKMFKLRTSTLTGRIDKAYREHQLIFKALSARNPQAAEDAMRNHIRDVMKDLIDKYASSE